MSNFANNYRQHIISNVAGLFSNAAFLKAMACLLFPVFILTIPTGWIGLEGLTTIQHRAIFVFALAAIFWIFEPIPIFATSMLVIFLMLVMMSDSAFTFLINNKGEASFGTLISYREIMGTLASPVIILFLGGFFLALAATKYRMDQQMAKVFIRPFGTNPRWVMLGLMIITAVFSMFMSNTATTAMMLAILVPFLATMEPADKGRIALVLGVPVAANIGGIGTPIGTPPNAIALKYLTGIYDITFGKWMMFGIPVVVILILFSWILISKLFPFSTKNIKLKIDTKKNERTEQHKRTEILIYATFAVTILLWLTDFIHGINSYVVALFPVIVFLCLNIITKEDLKLISWDVLWLVAGGLALGLALSNTGLAENVISNIPFADISPYLIFVVAAGLGLLMANFMSNTATANIFIPLLAVLSASIPVLREMGGPVLLISTTMAISLGMCLPISTPPNALAYGTGLITTKNLAKIGAIVGVAGVIIVFAVLILSRWIGLI